MPSPAEPIGSDGCRANREETARACHRPSLPGLRDPVRPRGSRRLRPLLRPAGPVYDRELQAAHRHAASRSRPGPPSIWRYADLLPVAAPAEPALAPGPDAARSPCRASPPRSASASLSAEARHREPDALVQGPRRRRRRREGARARARRRSRAPRPATSRTPSPRGPPPRGSTPSCSARPTSSARSSSRPRSTARRSTRSTAATTTAAGSPSSCRSSSTGAFVNVQLRSYYAEGSKTIAFEIAEQRGWTLPDVVVSPIASGSLFSKLHQGFLELRALGLVDGEPPRLIGAQAEGCSPVATAFAEGGQDPARAPADDRPLARDRQPRRRRAGRRDRAGVRRRRSTPCPRSGSARRSSSSPRATGIWGETAAGVTLGALREAVAPGQVGPDDDVVLLVTGDGLKTPGARRGRAASRRDRGRRRRAARPARGARRERRRPAPRGDRRDRRAAGRGRSRAEWS